MNPYDIHGPSYLLVYLIAWFISAVVAAVVADIIRRVDIASGESPDLHPYEMAYLTGGQDLALKSVIGYLILKNIARVDGAKMGSKIVLDGDPLSKLQSVHDSDDNSMFYRQSLQNMQELETKMCTSINGL